jgi:hypothetical protein
LLRIIESIYIQYIVMENKSLQVITNLHPTPNIQSSPIIFSTSLIPSISLQYLQLPHNNHAIIIFIIN